MERLLTAILTETGSVAALFRGLFLSFFLLALAGLLLARPRRAPTRLGFLYAVLFGAVFLYQACWQMTGFQSAPFRRFVNDYDPRPADTSRSNVTRGMIFDCKGRILAAPVAGQRRARQTALGEAGFHPVGYSHPRYGLAGVERVMDAVLNGLTPAPADSGERPHEALRRVLLATPAAQGGDVTLTLDLNLQRAGYELLKGRKGAIVAIDPRTGAIRALVSSPGTDMARFPQASLDAENAPLLNRALAGRYAPGSTFKIVMAALALEKGKPPVFDTPGEGYSPSKGTPEIRDSEYYAARRKGRSWPGWGKIDLATAFLHSSNVYFAQLGARHLTIDEVGRAVDFLRLTNSIPVIACGERTLAGAAGEIPKDFTSNRLGLAQTAIGQGQLALTPLHVALFTASIANGGSWCEPRLLAEDPPALKRVWQPETARRVTAMMRRAVVEGTGKGVEIPGLEVCGKTGTAETGRSPDNAWFTCFAPRQNPKLTITVIVEEGGFGAASAVPIAKEMLLKAKALKYL